ncbi:MAG TPA: hypothetical protein VFQ90_13955 [Stellaceae bacterium]|nr:hypothetical protein [Stellaceae bacterium]
MSIGEAIYLIAAAAVAELGRGETGTDDGGPAIDCRRLFGTSADTPGYRVRLSEGAEGRSLVVDRLDGLIELGDEAFRPLPVIGRLGRLFDAVAVPLAAEPPALRLHIGPALFAAAKVLCGETDG